MLKKQHEQCVLGERQDGFLFNEKVSEKDCGLAGKDCEEQTSPSTFTFLKLLKTPLVCQ